MSRSGIWRFRLIVGRPRSGICRARIIVRTSRLGIGRFVEGAESNAMAGLANQPAATAAATRGGGRRSRDRNSDKRDADGSSSTEIATNNRNPEAAHQPPAAAPTPPPPPNDAEFYTQIQGQLPPKASVQQQARQMRPFFGIDIRSNTTPTTSVQANIIGHLFRYVIYQCCSSMYERCSFMYICSCCQHCSFMYICSCCLYVLQ